MVAFESLFSNDENQPWEEAGPGVRRKIMAYDANLMLVKVQFEAGGIGAVHHHYHTQMSYIESGRFAITIGDETRELKAGDVYHVPPNIPHGALALEAGMLVDVFTPMREDFLKS
ncbi:cupin domain-containing protein [Larkinella arboricola]|uniref:Cupin domain-containing protein n=1 Tax=Larkinella arboricola TaxID=643671 RepID=A0A327X6G3_LARAB|nr:cupin domain-containing protein [Larkinella arboricola]RAK02259.1 Cupin domain-containing protein [Larkinella arboricola]